MSIPVLQAVRDALRRAGRPAGVALPEHPAAADAGDVAALVAGFRARAEPLGVRVQEVAAGGDALGEALTVILRGHGATRVAVPDPAAGYVASLRGAGFLFAERDDEVWECEAGLTSARLAIAETGTLVLDVAHERSRLASLLPPVHVCVVPTGALVATVGTALQRIGGEGVSSCVTFVTGPSRTADIELKLVVGVHGPRVLEVVFVHAE